MKNGITLHFVTLTLLVFNRAWAQVTLDGTLGRAGTLPGPDYQIGADLGQQHGGNLFHSFQDFNLQSHESATFSGPDNVQNVISRVTGGNPSSIDGTLRSTIPNADLYFLNPYGIMFGPNAKLDVQGGFHASTADYLRLSDGGRFEARYPNNSLLTVAPVAAFGFLTETPAAIKTQDSQLSVPKGKTFSLIGGDLELNATTPPVYGDDSTYNFMLFAESGRLHLASVASRGEVIPTPLGLDLQATAKGGPITLTNALLSVRGDEGNGNIFIRGGHFQMTRGWIENKNTGTQAGGVTDVQVEDLTFREEASIDTSTLGTGPGGSINLKVTNTLTLMTGGNVHVNSTDTTPQAGNSGHLTIQARQVNLSDGANLRAGAFGAGHGGTLHLQVSETLNVTNGMIDTNSYDSNLENAGNAGNVMIQARQVELTDGAIISSDTYGTGQSGTVHLEVSETLTANNGKIYADSNNTDLEKAGNAGGVTLQARNVNLTDGATISSNTYGTGQGGTVQLEVAETLTATHSNVSAGSYNDSTPKAGSAGDLRIHARQVNLSDGAYISSSTWGTGQGGTVHLRIAETLTATGVSPEGYPTGVFAESDNEELANAGNAGKIIIQARQINLAGGAQIDGLTHGTGQGGTIHLEIETLTATGISTNDYSSGVFASSENEELANAGSAGDVIIQARQVNLTDGAKISSSTQGSGQGGTVQLDVAETLTVVSKPEEDYSRLSGVYARSYKSENSGNAGDMIIRARNIHLAGGAMLSTDTYGTGQGGKVHLEVSDTLASNNGKIYADSNNTDLEKAGNAGGVTLQARNVNLTEGAVISSGTSGAGQGGTVHLEVSETLASKGGRIFTSSNNVYGDSDNPNMGAAGNVIVQARQVDLTDGAFISSGTAGTGQGGTVHLQVSDTLAANNSSIYADSNNSDLEKAGNAGNVIVQARQVDLTDGASISSDTYGTGQSGTVHLQAETLTATGVNAEGYPSAVATTSENHELANAGAAGNLRIEARQVVLTNGGKLTSGTLGTGLGGTLSLQVEDTLTIAGQGFNGKKSSVVANSRGTMENAGPAGLLNIQAKTINILKDGEISTQSENAGGGDLTIVSPNLLYLQQGQITTSVKGGKGNGGNITINTPVFVILASAKIIAQAEEGHGGNIAIRANQFIATPPPDSLVSASSRLGIDGQVVISSPDPNLSSKLFLVSTKGLDVTNQLKRPCGGAKTLEEIMNPRFKFYVYPIAGSRQSVEDWGPSPLPSRSASSSNQGKTGKGSARGRGKPTTEKVAQAEYQPVALVVECPKEESTGRLE